MTEDSRRQWLRQAFLFSTSSVSFGSKPAHSASRACQRSGLMMQAHAVVLWYRAEEWWQKNSRRRILESCLSAFILLPTFFCHPLSSNSRVAQVQPVPRSGRKPKGQRGYSSAPCLGNTACTHQLPAPAAHALQACYPATPHRLASGMRQLPGMRLICAERILNRECTWCITCSGNLTRSREGTGMSCVGPPA